MQLSLGARNFFINSLVELCFVLDTFAFNENRLDSALDQINQQTAIPPGDPGPLSSAEIEILKECLAAALEIEI